MLDPKEKAMRSSPVTMNRQEKGVAPDVLLWSFPVDDLSRTFLQGKGRGSVLSVTSGHSCSFSEVL
jgi:hypothetical protein